MKQSTSFHVAIVMDGNGRWATRRGLPRAAGHRAGAAAVRRVVKIAPGCGITALTLYAFSSDNWTRPAAEVDMLMRLFAHHLRTETAELVAQGVKLLIIGRRDRLPRSLIGAVAGVVGGIVGDQLLRAMPWGLNMALGTTALVGTGAWLLRRHNVKPGPDAAWLAITALLLGLAFLRRDAQPLDGFDALALIGTLG